jgi:hypothetical protein
LGAALAITLAMCAPAGAQTPAPAKDPAAIAALEGMSSYLRALKAFQVESVTTTDEVLDNGLLSQHAGKTTFLVEMPNRLFAIQSSEAKERTYLYDGKSFTLWASRPRYYATVPAPATLSQLDDELSAKYDIEIPLADLFRFGSSGWNASDITAAADLGPAVVAGVTCQHYAFRQEGIDWQVWIQKGAFPLPRKMVITTTSDPARPQHSSLLTWNLAPSYSAETFTFDPPADAKRIVLAVVSQ